MKKVVVDGATGFLGEKFVAFLLEKDISVLVLIRDKNRLRHLDVNNKLLSVVEVDFKDVSPIVLPEGDYDAYYHLAWAGVCTKDKNNREIQLSNLEFSLRAFDLCKSIKCRRYIFCGSVAEYGLIDGLIDGRSKPCPGDLYGAVKASVDFCLRIEARNAGIDYIHVIMPSLYGEGREDSNILSYTIKTLLNGEVPHYGDLNKPWDFLYVEDAVRALLLIGEKGKTDTTYGISSGELKLLRNYIEIIRDIISPNAVFDIEVSDEQTKKSVSSCVSGFDLMRDTGFIASVSFEDGIKRVIAYSEKRGGITWKDKKNRIPHFETQRCAA